ncbi:MAG: serine/threonine protein kinase [Planctomycetes bacterium]|nr:serine/threonine protein kinase [Planctomycetota bacterium]
MAAEPEHPEDAPSDDPIERLLFECLEADEPERAVDRAAIEHPDLADELRRAYAEMARFDLVGEATPPPAAAESMPEQLGDYRLLERLGAGGMGVVYLARDVVLQRTVALKLIRPEHLYLPGARERFQREVETIARLQHAGIVPIYGVGKSDGMPYFTMQHINGCSLSAALSELQRRETPPDGRALLALVSSDASRDGSGSTSGTGSSAHGIDGLAWPDVCVSLAIQVAAALHHAHERGVLHRDVKPSNVLITTDGRARLVDFGLARLEGAQQLTATTSQIGSLPYLPPEQLDDAAVIPSAHQDVYALGVTLYEMLTLDSAFQRDSAEATRAAIRDGRPRPLRQRNPAVNDDLATVCATAMAHEPARRYATMADFVRDLDNVRCHRPIEARRPTTWVRLGRWAQRHPTATASAGVGVLLIAVAAVLFAVYESGARQRSDELRTAAEQRAREAAEVTDFLVDLFRFASPDKSLGEDLPVGLLLQQGAERIQRELQDQPEVCARLLGTFGRVYSWLGENERSAEFFVQAARMQQQHSGPADADVLRYRIQEAGDRIMLGDYPTAEQLLADVEQRLPTTPPAERDRLWFDATRQRSLLLHTRDDSAGAERLQRQMLAAARNAPDDLATQANATRSFARFLAAELRHREALGMFRESLELLRRLHPQGHPIIGDTTLMMATTLAKLHQFEEAQRLASDALAQCLQVFGPEHPRTVLARRAVATVYRDAGDLRRALEQMEQCVEVVRGLRRISRNFFSRSLNDLAITYHELGRYEDARTLLDEALIAAREAFAGDHILTATLLVNLANAESELGRQQDARGHAAEGIAMKRRIDAAGRSLPRSLNTRALIHSRIGTPDALRAAEADADEAIELARANADQGWELGRGYSMKAFLANLRGDGAAAERHGRRALDEFEAVDPRDHPRKAMALYHIAWAKLLQGGGLAAAEPLLQRSIAMYERMPQTYPEKAYPLNHYGYELVRERAAEAKPLLQEALEIRKRVLPRHARWRLITAINLANAHQRLDEFEPAEQLLLEVYEVLAEQRGKDSAEARSSAQRLEHLYRRWGKPERAAHYEALK